MTTIDAVVFDFGGVLIDIDYSLTSKAFQLLDFPDFDAFFTQATQSDLFSDFETGKIPSKEFIQALSENLPKGVAEQSIIDAWNAMLLEVPKTNVELLERLSGKYQLFMLSNTNEIHLPVAIENWGKVANKPLQSYFQKVYLSHEIGLRKPSTDAFEFVCNQNNLVPARTLFIDDTIRHIEGAKKAGLQVIHLKEIMGLTDIFE